jgi:hypothetical protein
MSRAAVEQLLYLMDQAFEEDGEHSLVRNLTSVSEDGWLWVPPAGSRNVRQIVGHVAACKFMYDNFGFGDGAMAWDSPAGTDGTTMEELQSAARIPDEPARDAVLNWLREGHRRIRDHVAELNDEELLRQRRRPEGGTKATRWIIGVMIEHDLTTPARSITCVRSIRRRTAGRGRRALSENTSGRRPGRAGDVRSPQRRVVEPSERFLR